MSPRRHSKVGWKGGLFFFFILLFSISYWILALGYVETKGIPHNMVVNVMFNWDFFIFYWKAVLYLINGLVNR